MKAIILAAGEGKRLRPLTNSYPKCLLPYKDTSFLERLIFQIKKYGIEEIIVVVGYQKDSVINKIGKIKGVKIVINDKYKMDTNIHSMLLAVNEAVENKISDVVVFEADMVGEGEFINYVTGPDFEGKSAWFTRGKFQQHQNGGILKTDGKGNIIEIKIVDKFEKKYEEYDKLTGIMRIAASELAPFYKLLEEYCDKTIRQYYLIPWIENLDKLPCIKGDASHYLFNTFNTSEEYKQIKDNNFDTTTFYRRPYLAEVNKLYPVERHDKGRISRITKFVIQEGYWKKPLRIEKNHNLVLDGHHSLELAKEMKLQFVPVIGFDYDEIEMWSLREEIPLTKELVIKNATQGDIYPYKTVKHKFPDVRYECNINLEELL